MVSEEEYLKAKKIVEEYEEAEFQHAQTQALYCVSCQALEAHDCFCDEEDDGICNMCSGVDNNHYVACPYNTDPYDNLISEGYD